MGAEIDIINNNNNNNNNGIYSEGEYRHINIDLDQSRFKFNNNGTSFCDEKSRKFMRRKQKYGRNNHKLPL